ncbi:GntR family transcriptional regulator [Desertihabitans aurantiacus]|uniref:GntR family transcriptional regulator n=1 Tax=Desertihabitans aurantiacus TaxID=2282477 RepID=UPI000DF7C914|nr:GntR family transcriptional regulator [Desertihabitans aurantiacus]
MPTELPRSLLSEDALPLYGRIARRLWADVEAERAGAGDRLPPERALAERYAVSRVTVRAALAELQARGLVEPVQGRGWTVRGADAPATPNVLGFADYAQRLGLQVGTRVLQVRTRPAGHDEAERLRMLPGADLFELRRLRYLDAQVVALEHNRVPLALCPGLTAVDFGTASLYATLRAADPPQLPGTAGYSVEARTPDEEERRLLEITGDVPLLVATQLTANQHDRPLELTVQAYRGDRYRFQGRITS